MNKIAFLSPGQGAQKAGMGKDFYDSFACSKEIFDKANEVLDKANEAVKIAGQINEASYMLDKDENIKYAYAIYTERGIPHLALTPINE